MKDNILSQLSRTNHFMLAELDYNRPGTALGPAHLRNEFQRPADRLWRDFSRPETQSFCTFRWLVVGKCISSSRFKIQSRELPGMSQQLLVLELFYISNLLAVGSSEGFFRGYHESLPASRLLTIQWAGWYRNRTAFSIIGGSGINLGSTVGCEDGSKIAVPARLIRTQTATGRRSLWLRLDPQLLMSAELLVDPES